MDIWTFVITIGFALFGLSKEEFTLNPCAVRDIECLSNSTEQFLEKTSKGISEYDIRPIDPLFIASYTYEFDKDAGIYFHHKNITVTGLKNQKISDFQMNLETKSVELKTKADLHFVSDITIELTKDSKSFSGVYTADSSVIGTARYNYELKKDDQGVEHFEVGPEKLTCETIGQPDVSLNKELNDAVISDSTLKMHRPDEGSSNNLMQVIICDLVELAYVDVVHNIRASAKILPKTAFFIDV